MTLKGMQLIINNNMDNSDGHMIINFINQEFDSAQFKYETDLTKFDIKKIYCGNEDQQRYYLLAKASVQTKLIVGNQFNNFEFNYLLEAQVSTLLHMVAFDFANIILVPLEKESSDFNSLKFFKSQEILAGKSLCDLYLTNPNRINIALMNLKQKKVDAQCSIVEQHVADMPRLMKERLI